MNTTLLYRLFGLGRFPKQVRAALEQEGMLACDEGISGRLITRDFKAPGKRFKFRCVGFSGAIALTRKRLIAYAYWRRLINIPLDDPRLEQIDMRMMSEERLELDFESALFHPDWQGRITVQLRTSKAQSILDTLRRLGPPDRPEG